VGTLYVVTETYPPEVNGVAHTLARLVAGLRGRGHAVSVVRPRQGVADERESPSGLRDILVPGLPLPGYRGLRFGLPARRALRAHWRVSRPDAVYVATEGPLGWSALRAAARLAIPAFSGFHTNYHAYLAHYRAGWLEPLGFPYLRYFHNRSQGTLVASEDLRDRLESAGVRNLHVLGRGVDSDLFSPERRSADLRRSWGAGEGNAVVLHVGRLAPEKNIPLAIAAFGAMRQVDPSAILVVVGDGPLRAALERVHPDVRFCGLRTGISLAEHYASADVFLFPSETETFGNVTLEAMASGLAVVAYDYAAARTHIRDGESGVLVPYGQPRAFISAATCLAGSSGAIARLRGQARAHAITVDWGSVVERFAEILRGSQAAAGDGVRAPRAAAVTS
jgi:glycosyltransferase involved in cell wall biosynthesis